VGDHTDIAFATVDLPLARYIAWSQRGFGHAAIISKQKFSHGAPLWLDARSGGVAYRPAEKNLCRLVILRVPFDVEPIAASLIGTPYNYRGIVAFKFHFYWRAHGLFCSQFVLEAIERRLVELKRAPMSDLAYRDQVDPLGLYHMINAFDGGVTYGAAAVD
jgi:hypothetical protein